MHNILSQISLELAVDERQIRVAVDLLDGGATVPFIARYRKEATGGLDDVVLRALESRLGYLRELHDRRLVVLKAIGEQGKLTSALHAAIDAAGTRQELEDLYLPFKHKRRSRGELAREAGLEALADKLFSDPRLVPIDEAQSYVLAPTSLQASGEGQPGFATPQAVLDGVRDILSERWAEQSTLVQDLREWLWACGLLQSRLRSGRDESLPDVAKFRDYFDYQEPIRQVPSHRALAAFRGRTQEILDLQLALPEGGPAQAGGAATARAAAETRIGLHIGWAHQGRVGDDFLLKCVAWTWRVKLSLSCESDLFARLRAGAESIAIKVFSDNLRDLLLAAPAGPRVVMGLDPGIRTGVKVAVVDKTGKLVETATVYPHEPRKDWNGSLQVLWQLCQKHGVDLIAIGNGTASRETDKLAGDLIARIASGPETAKPVKTAGALDCGRSAPEKVLVSEAGASIYSASAFASQEMPDVDVSLRGAASIARRLQDPLAELVKIDPKSIGVGQYQHDVNQSVLARSLDAVVEDCVNAVGVDLNTASVPLLARVSGLSASVAGSLVRWRDTHGGFRNRQQLLQVAGLGIRTFEQCAGFLRIRDGDNPLDMTGVHPETYAVVEKILLHSGLSAGQLMGRTETLQSMKPELFTNAGVGVVTVRDILTELEKPGRDPRPGFRAARLKEDVHDIGGLKEGMILEGTVTNVAAFGAFVDIGVHQDGLVHLSQLSDKFVTDARAVVKAGVIVTVKVLEVDHARKRIALTMKLGEKGSSRHASGEPADIGLGYRRPTRGARPEASGASAMARAFEKVVR